MEVTAGDVVFTANDVYCKKVPYDGVPRDALIVDTDVLLTPEQLAGLLSGNVSADGETFTGFNTLSRQRTEIVLLTPGALEGQA